MRNVLITLAAAGSALAFATPAAAQYFPQPQPYGYGYPQPQPYGYGYGFHNNYGQVRALQARINHVERQIARLDRRDRIRDRSADRLRQEANRIERRLRVAARYGLNPHEANDISLRVARLEQRVQFAVQRRYGRGYGYGQGYQGYYGDRDRDGRYDRYEDDRGWDHD